MRIRFKFYGKTEEKITSKGVAATTPQDPETTLFLLGEDK